MSRDQLIQAYAWLLTQIETRPALAVIAQELRDAIRVMETYSANFDNDASSVARETATWKLAEFVWRCSATAQP